MKKDEIPESQSASLHSDYHIPVLLNQAIGGLCVVPSGVYVDCTFGAGGHSRAILKLLNSDGKLLVFDQDEDAKKNLPVDERIIFVPQNFRHLQRFLKLYKYEKVNGVLADLGVSSHQLDEAERGFSTRFDAILDMRMDKRQIQTAADLIMVYSETQLHKIFEKYGEVSNSRTLAKTIVQQRMIAPVKTVNQFKQVITHVVKGNPNKYYAQVFQALRIEVNDEMGALKDMLLQSLSLLKTGGRIVVISFHSLEDRIVKNFFRDGGMEGQQTDMIYGTKEQPSLRVITKKPIVANQDELIINPRSRSAKLRIAEKI